MLPLRRTSYLLVMASRTEWFKEFVSCLDKKASYENRVASKQDFRLNPRVEEQTSTSSTNLGTYVGEADGSPVADLPIQVVTDECV